MNGSKTRKLLTSRHMHHPRADVDCLYFPKRRWNGRIHLEMA